jgi:hypothetical protein
MHTKEASVRRFRKSGYEDTHLTRNSNLVVFLVSFGAFLLIRVVENDGYTSFRDTSLSSLVDEIGLVLCSHLLDE